LGPIEFGERVNLLTGDNGLGKSFLLDMAWWVFTQTWAGEQPWPRPETNRESPPEIGANLRIRGDLGRTEWYYCFSRQRWIPRKNHTDASAAMVVHLGPNGESGILDPAQIDWPRALWRRLPDWEGPTPLRLSAIQGRNGVRLDDGRTLCRGLIDDLVTWQQTNSPEFEAIQRVLTCLSPPGPERLVFGKPTRVSKDDQRLHPTLALPYGEIPVSLASAGMQRILLLAYLLVWAWHSHLAASKMVRRDPERSMVVLLDEPEMHLHPRWQRAILPSLLLAIDQLQGDLQVQLIVSTHSPLVLGSMEPIFDRERDKLLELSMDEETTQVEIYDRPWSNQGDATAWLTSDTFGLRQARSLPAEIAIDAANRFMRGEAHANPEHLRSKEQIHEELNRVLDGDDLYRSYWTVATDPSTLPF